MSHITNKMKFQKEKNNKRRVRCFFNTGEREMGYESNQARKVASHMAVRKNLNY